jgi:hemerythrin superfamily protein
MHLKSTQFLRDDHKRIVGLFTQYLASKSRAPELEAGMSREILIELELHSQIEEKVFYPALQSAMSLEEKPSVVKSFDDHRRIDDMVARFKTLEPHSQQFRLWMLELQRQVQEHITFEEGDLFKIVEHISGFDDQNIATKMDHLRGELIKLDHFNVTLPESGATPFGGEQMRKKSA